MTDKLSQTNTKDGLGGDDAWAKSRGDVMAKVLGGVDDSRVRY